MCVCWMCSVCVCVVDVYYMYIFGVCVCCALCAGAELVVMNMSQQTDSADLLGGYIYTHTHTHTSMRGFYSSSTFQEPHDILRVVFWEFTISRAYHP